jgi:tetratricopeptide (TPR) repeat protein
MPTISCGNMRPAPIHEYAHHLQLRTAAVAVPAWLTEGFAEFFATARVGKDGSVTIGLPPQYRAYGIMISSGLELDQMLGASYRNLTDAQVDELYGKGWLLVHYMNFKDERRPQLAKYLEAIHNGKSALTAAQTAFGDLKVLEKELERYKRGKIPGLVVGSDRLKVGPIAVRPLGEGEAAVMDVHIRSTRGVDRRTAPDVAIDAREAAAPYPDDPFAQSVLAEAEHDTGNYEAAEAAADRALAANPNFGRALIYKGRARLELATKNPEKSDWKGVRSWFTRANKLDTENAEPLMLFYLTYVQQGIEPTKNAVDALVYANALAPQDDGLRGMAVQQLLIDQRTAEAKRLFAPLAFQPHLPDEWRNLYGRIMEAISAGDSKGALKLMEQGPEKVAEGAKKP